MSQRQTGKSTVRNGKNSIINSKKLATGARKNVIQRGETKIITKLPDNNEKTEPNVLPAASDLLRRPHNPTLKSNIEKVEPVKRFWIPLNDDDEEFIDSIFKEYENSSTSNEESSESESESDVDQNSHGRVAVRFHTQKRRALMDNNEEDNEKEHVLYFYARSDPDKGTESEHLMARPDPQIKCRLYGFIPPSKRGLRVDTPCRKAGLSLRKNRDICEYGLKEVLLCDKKTDEANSADDKDPSLKIIVDVERLISGNRGLLECKAILSQREEKCRELESKRKSLLKIIERREEILEHYKEQLAGKEARYRELFFDHLQTKSIMNKQKLEIERLLKVEKDFYEQRDELDSLKEDNLSSEFTTRPITIHGEQIRPRVDITSTDDVAVFSSRVTNVLTRLANQSYGAIDEHCIEDVTSQFECCVDVMERLFKENIVLKQHIGLEADFPFPKEEEIEISKDESKDVPRTASKPQEPKPSVKSTQKVTKENLKVRKIGAQTGHLRATNHVKDKTVSRRWR